MKKIRNQDTEKTAMHQNNLIYRFEIFMQIYIMVKMIKNSTTLNLKIFSTVARVLLVPTWKTENTFFVNKYADKNVLYKCSDLEE